jgi:hypothetical protein
MLNIPHQPAKNELFLQRTLNSLVELSDDYHDN